MNETEQQEALASIGPAAALYGALAKAQGAFQPIVKNRDVTIAMKAGGSYRFRYADLEEIIAKTRPALSANGLALIQTVEHGQQGPLLVCRLMHAQGGMIASEVSMPTARDLGDPKAFGAAITYLRRYMVTAMLGVAADDDLDEDGQEAGNRAGGSQEHPQLQAGRDASMQGMKELTAWWGKLEARDRSELNDAFKGLRAAALRADQEASRA